MFNIIKSFFKKAKATADKEITPSKKLWDDIQKDYYYYDEIGNYKLSNQKGFLNKELLINGNKYYFVPCCLESTTFKLEVKDEADKDVFTVKILYGPRCSKPNQHVLYIETFQRLTDYRCGIGKEMLKYVREMAESRGFNVIVVNAVAMPCTCKDAMNQEQLEKFYEKYLNGTNVSLEFMNNSDDVGYY